MAKKESKPAASTDRVNKRIRARDKTTLAKVVSLADDVAKNAFKGGDINIAIPTRTRANTLWNKKRGILQMGDAKSARELFNLNQAKQFMQTVLHGDSIKQLIEAEKTLSLRGMFYKALHTIQGTAGKNGGGEKTFANQAESDVILENLEVAMGSFREKLHLYAQKGGTMGGNIPITQTGARIDCPPTG